MPRKTPGWKDVDMERRRAGGLRWLVRAGLVSDALERALSAPDATLSAARPVAVGRAHGFIVKRYVPDRWSKRAKLAFRGSPARHAFRVGLAMELAGIPTARVVAIAESPGPWWPLRSYLVTEEIPRASHLGERAGELGRGGDRTVAELLAKLHESGFSHADLNGTNVLMTPEGDPILIDLDEARRLGRTPDARAAADLARFSRKFADIPPLRRARFLRAYAEARGRSDWRGWWRRIEEDNRCHALRKARRRERSAGAA